MRGQIVDALLAHEDLGITPGMSVEDAAGLLANAVLSVVEGQVDVIAGVLAEHDWQFSGGFYTCRSCEWVGRSIRAQQRHVADALVAALVGDAR